MYGPCTRPVYTTRVHDCVRAVCTDVFGRVHGTYTTPYTGHVQGRVRAVHTAMYTTRIRLRTRVYMSTCTRPCYTAVYGPSTRPKTAVYTAVYGRGTCRVYGRVRRPLLGRPTGAHVYTAVKRPCMRHVHVRVHGQYTVVYMAGRPTRPRTRAETARCGRGPCTRP